MEERRHCHRAYRSEHNARSLLLAQQTYVLVVADNADVSVLLCHFVFNGDITGHAMMTSPTRGQTAININASVDKNRAIMDDLLAVHVLYNWL